MTRKFRFATVTALVAEAVETLAMAYPYHPVRLWLRGLPQWDRIDRLESWLVDYVGVKDSAYSRLVGKWFFIGMIARVMRPGVKFDYRLVLEGPQGRCKSMVASTLGAWFGDTDLDLQNKDAASALRGKWIYEFPEMGSVTRVEASKQKSFCRASSTSSGRYTVAGKSSCLGSVCSSVRRTNGNGTRTPQAAAGSGRLRLGKSTSGRLLRCESIFSRKRFAVSRPVRNFGRVRMSSARCSILNSLLASSRRV